MGHVTTTTPLSGTICRLFAGTGYDSAVYQIWNLYVHSLWRYERQQKMQILGGLGVSGHSRSSEISPFDRAHMTSYSTLIETMHLFCTVFELLSLISQNWKRHMPLLGWFFICFVRLDIAYLCTKVDSSSLSRSLDMDGGSKIYKWLCYGRGTARRAWQEKFCNLQNIPFKN